MATCYVAKEDDRPPAPPVDLARSPIRYGAPAPPPGLAPWYVAPLDEPSRVSASPGHPYRSLSWEPPLRSIRS